MSRGSDDAESAAFAAALQGALAREQPRVIAPATDELALVIINGPSLGRVLPLTGAQALMIGRAPRCNLCLADAGVARVHMSITPMLEGWIAKTSTPQAARS